MWCLSSASTESRARRSGGAARTSALTWALSLQKACRLRGCPYEADLPPGWRVESGFSRAQRFGSPHVELEVGDRGVANVAGDAAMLCYLVASEAGDVITYCSAPSDVIP